jgi:hypothetical protein
MVGSPDWLARTCLLWEATYDVVDRAFRHLPRVHVIRYEDLVEEPLEGFAELYGRVGLTWSPAAASRVRAATTDRPAAAQGSHRWSLRGGISRTAFRPMGGATALTSYRGRLSPAEIDRIRNLTGRVAARVLDGVRSDADEIGTQLSHDVRRPTRRKTLPQTGGGGPDQECECVGGILPQVAAR